MLRATVVWSSLLVTFVGVEYKVESLRTPWDEISLRKHSVQRPYFSNPSPMSSASKLSCHITRRTLYINCRPIPPANLVSELRMLAPLPYIVESESLNVPAAFLKVSNNGSTVSFCCFQNSSFTFFVRRRAEKCCTPMSCRPVSCCLTKEDKYEYSLGSASSSRLADFEELVIDIEISFVRNVAASRGIGSSGLFELLRNPRNFS